MIVFFFVDVVIGQEEDLVILLFVVGVCFLFVLWCMDLKDEKLVQSGYKKKGVFSYYQELRCGV